MFEKILVCLDGSSRAEQILPYVSEEALHFGSKVVLLKVITLPSTVITPAVPGAPGVTGSAPEIVLEQIHKQEDEALVYLEAVAQPLRKKGLEVECVTLQGAPGEAIISHADENEVGLIAIATHGRSGLGRMVFGSVADFVLRESGLPVLVIKPPEADG